MKKIVYLWIGVLGGILLGGQSAQAAPRTQTPVSRPTTSQTVYQPLTQSVATHPVTTSTAAHPTTKDSVSKPSTNTVVTHPTTSNTVSHPQTDVLAPASATPNESSSHTTGASSSQKGAAVETNLADKPSMMSTYTPPQATNFKEAKLGGGEEGLGKLNQAEKDAAAKSFVIPKGEEVSLENVMKSDGNTVNLKKKVEKKVNSGS